MAKQNLICMNSAGYDIRHLHYQPYTYCFLVSQTQKVWKVVEIRQNALELVLLQYLKINLEYGKVIVV